MVVLILVVVLVVLSLIAHSKINKLEDDARVYRMEASEDMFKLSQELTEMRFELLSMNTRQKTSCCNSKKAKEVNEPKQEDEPVNKKKRTSKKTDK